ncbi:hypothetical protein CRM22_001362 [Opisthorchis felineus]|uniref:Ion transport domain-containing protein n=1 Tax=Opisthorchis felineus TaxID=147828 RepID=A0A4S2MH06_OPIFE|nr:hypothetical protein CRM22_001362 [Opisthorchis felineus]
MFFLLFWSPREGLDELKTFFTRCFFVYLILLINAGFRLPLAMVFFEAFVNWWIDKLAFLASSLVFVFINFMGRIYSDCETSVFADISQSRQYTWLAGHVLYFH